MRFALTAIAIVTLTAASATAQPQPQKQPQPPDPRPQRPPAASEPRYLPAIRAELEAMRIPADCETVSPTRANCVFRQSGRTSAREFTIHAEYSDETDTIYFYVERYLVVRADTPNTTRVLRRLMELNWNLLVGKLEWDSQSGEVRLAMVLNTDSNFDRRAFRSMVRGMTLIADRYWSELDRLNSAAGAPAAPAGGGAPAGGAP